MVSDPEEAGITLPLAEMPVLTSPPVRRESVQRSPRRRVAALSEFAAPGTRLIDSVAGMTTDVLPKGAGTTDPLPHT